MKKASTIGASIGSVMTSKAMIAKGLINMDILESRSPSTMPRLDKSIMSHNFQKVA